MGSEGYEIYMEWEYLSLKFLTKPMQRENDFEGWKYFFRKFHIPHPSRINCCVHKHSLIKVTPLSWVYGAQPENFVTCSLTKSTKNIMSLDLSKILKFCEMF